MNKIRGILFEPQHRKLLVDYLYTGSIQFLNNFLPFLAITYAVRILGPDKYGQINYAQSVILYFTLIINYGFDLTAAREINQNKENPVKLNAIFTRVLSAKMILLFFCFLILVFSFLIFDKIREQALLFFLTFLVNVGFMLFPSWFFQGMSQMKHAVFYTLFSKIFFLASVFLLVHASTDYLVIPTAQSLGQVMIGLVAVFYVAKKYHFRWTLPDSQSVIEILKQGFPVFVSTIAASLCSGMTIFYLGFFANDTELGLFSATYKLIAVIFVLVSVPLNMTLFPHIADLIQKSNVAALRYVFKICTFVGILTFLLGVALYFTSDLLINLVFGKNFSGSVASFKILVFMPLIITISSILGTVTMVNLKMDKFYSYITLTGALLSLFLNLWLDSVYKEIGASVAWVITEIFVLLACAGMLFHRFKFMTNNPLVKNKITDEYA